MAADYPIGQLTWDSSKERFDEPDPIFRADSTMDERLLYRDGALFGGIHENRLLIKGMPRKPFSLIAKALME
ncbi:MAG: hypothetical protein LKG11_06285 [Bacilli bacterium]|jgi:hypothetical protein|nr:hypothetical protein [Bacilli bacterium]